MQEDKADIFDQGSEANCLSLNQSEYTVTEISGIIKSSIEQNFGVVHVRGEVSGLKIAPSGHVYFSLKDEHAVLAAICWKGSYLAMPDKPQEGLEMVCVGELTTYQLQSRYQLIVSSVKVAGVGALMALLEKRKQQLQKEGLFDVKHKKKLPFLPNTIGVITSPTGSVIQDILHRIEDRFPVRVLIWPVLVQGDQSAKQVSAAIAGFNKMEKDKPDVLIIARGGGSIEDLWPFNEEIIARAAFASNIPIISAIGHETDTTLLDYVADVRAPTPSAAAEMAVPLRRDLIAFVDELKKRMTVRLNIVAANYTQKLDELFFRLIEALNRELNNLALRLQVFKDRLSVDALYACLEKASKRLEELNLRILKAVENALEKRSQELAYLTQLIASFDYKNVLKRGFAVIRGQHNKLVQFVRDIPEEISIEMQDGIKTIQIKK